MSMAVPRPKNGIINTTAGFIMLPESSDNGVSEETIETVPKKQPQNKLDIIQAKISHFEKESERLAA